MSGYIVGSETSAIRGQQGFSGIPRVVREAHVGLDAALRPQGIEIVPVVTRQPDSSVGPRDLATAATDPVLSRPVHELDDVDAFLLLGLTMTTDFGRILRLRRERHLPTIAIVYDILPVLHPEWFLPRAREHYRAYLQQLLRVSDHIVVTSAVVRTGLLELGWRIPGEIHVMPLGSTFAQQPPTSAAAPPLGLMYVSTVAPRKGHLLLLEAFDTLRSRGMDTRLTIVGKLGWMADELATAITSHPEFGSRLNWERNATDDDIVRTAHHCHVGVIPAEDEGYGLFLDESLTLGLTCVARDIPVFRERSQYPNLLFADGSAQGLADAILLAQAPPRALAIGDIRTMTDFTNDLAAMVLSTLP